MTEAGTPADAATGRAERVRSEIKGVRHIDSVSGPGMAVVRLQFEVGEDRTDAIVRLHSKVLSNQDRLPPSLGAGQIEITKQVRGLFEETADIVDIDDSVEYPPARLLVVANRAKAARLGVAQAAVAQALATLLNR